MVPTHIWNVREILNSPKVTQLVLLVVYKDERMPGDYFVQTELVEQTTTFRRNSTFKPM